MPRIPSVKTIETRLSVDRAKAKRIRALMDGSAKTMEYQSVKNWVKQCDSMPPKIERILLALDEELDGFGREGIEDENHWDRFWGHCVATYINQGDTYDTTIVYDTVRESFYVTSMGDYVETYERSKRGRIR